jgi:methylmalonyl-CoA mutase cobalamin-binding domain/chain
MGTIRVIIAKVGLDGHDRGAKVVAGHGTHLDLAG